MNEEQTSQESAPQPEARKDDIGDELNRLAESFGRAVQAAWNSEQRHQLETDLNRGLRSLVDNVESILKQFNESEQGQELKEQAGKVVEKVRTSKVTADLKEGVTKGLQTVAEELQEFAQDLEKKRQASPGESAAQDIPVEKAETGNGE
ncbi:MAG: hypothetical protein KJZ86_25655 [Caldilineaceae bacterium]|nr:hypothetical protein [Caldilineaceae bacterium]HRJ45473.1 hypothetical protein [Caldilineaceae bacterium]